MRRTPAACCSASTSVGAISAPWCPPCTAASSALTATSVLPAPTSPCSRRCIGCGPARSASISAIARRCAPVSSNGRAAVQPLGRARRRPSWRMPRDSRSSARLRSTSTVWTRSSSSNASRRRACSLSRDRLGQVDAVERRRAVDAARSAGARRRRERVGDAPRAAACASASSTQPAISHVDQRGLLALRVDRHDATGAVADEVDDRVGHLQPAAVHLGLAEQRDLQCRRAAAARATAG